jgi:2-keto-4-pentenoate hydratase/2-oxohepta-3-ene-1,7-dioic acid hydratase in catechol pathway
MNILTYLSGRGPRLAVLVPGGIIDLNDADPKLPFCAQAFLAGGGELIALAKKAMSTGTTLPLPDVLLPPIVQPEKVICIGLNYADHAKETNAATPSCPVIFNKFPTALVGQGQSVVHPAVSKQVDYEAELVVVIGKQGRDIPEEKALEYVAGYTCGNDISARDWQKNKPGGQWLSGKSFDTFAPCGPWIVTADELGDPQSLTIEMRLNSQVMQHSNTSQLIFSIPNLISYISNICTLKVGDLIYTGTPSGVGVARTPQVFLKPGDKLEVEIERIGVLRNTIV